MAIHTGLGRGDHRNGRLFDTNVTVAAIQPKLPGMKLMTVGYRLVRPVSNIGKPGGEIIPYQKYDQSHRYQKPNGKYQGQTIRPAWKYLRQISGLSRASAFPYPAAGY
jgi:hypothetical protein